jgi:REP element-mobilizing transposase RayT
MPRKPRIEYNGAVYHVMNRGDRGGRIFKDKLDHGMFLATLGECCARCGWRIHSYCLMPNHFHILLETPEGNLVAGMKWFLGAYTQKFNSRHGQRGHVFQGRYKAQLIKGDSGNYFEVVSTYIHLNPARGGLLSRERPVLRSYPWSSYVQYLDKTTRPAWLEAGRVLGNMGLKDDRKGLTEYQRYMQGRVLDLRTRTGKKQYDQSWKAIRYGWCIGDAGFEDEMVKRLKGVIMGRRRESYSGEEDRRHDEVEATKLMEEGMRRLGVEGRDLKSMKKGAAEKMLLAWLVHGRAMVGNSWIAERLLMGTSANIGKYVRVIAMSNDPRIMLLRKKLEKA